MAGITVAGQPRCGSGRDMIMCSTFGCGHPAAWRYVEDPRLGLCDHHALLLPSWEPIVTATEEWLDRVIELDVRRRAPAVGRPRGRDRLPA
jgi:hypothetical protein